MVFPTKDAHFPRKIFHAAGASLVPTLYYFEIASRDFLLISIAVIATLWIFFEFLRFKVAPFNLFFLRCFSFLMKTKEVHIFTGVTFMLIGTLLSFLLFSPIVAVTSLFFIAIGDPVAAIAGKAFGRKKLANGKTFEGSVAMFFSCLCVGALVMGFEIAMIAGAFTATVAELLAGKIDDNLTAPLSAGFVMTILG